MLRVYVDDDPLKTHLVSRSQDSSIPSDTSATTIMATSYVIPPGYSPSRYTITTDDHSGWAVVASSISLMVALFFGFIIVCYRYMAGRFAGRKYDACIVTFMVSRSNHLEDSCTQQGVQIFALPQSVFVISAASQSLGKSTSLLDTNVQTETEQVSNTCNDGLNWTPLTRASSYTRAIFFTLSRCPSLVLPSSCSSTPSSVEVESTKVPPRFGTAWVLISW